MGSGVCRFTCTKLKDFARFAAVDTASIQILDKSTASLEGAVPFAVHDEKPFIFTDTTSFVVVAEVATPTPARLIGAGIALFHMPFH